MAEQNRTYDNTRRKWLKPSKRGAGYAEERKLGVHQRGKNKGKPLDDYNKGVRSGYMLAQSDNAGMYRYMEAKKAGYSREECAEYSRQKGTKLQPKETKPKGGGRGRKPKLEAIGEDDEVGIPF